MKTKRLTRRRARRVVLSSLASLGLLLSASVVQAESGYMSTWSSLYPASASENVASCQICHADSTQNVNPYGRAFCLEGGTVTQRLQAIQGQDSDGDPTGSDNLTEILASAQPGWTTAAVPIYSRSTCNPTGTTETAPFNGLLDPEAVSEICDNGIDDNGNGLVDCEDPGCDNFTGEATSCGVGACTTTGNLVCQNGGEVDTCTPLPEQPEGPFDDASCSDGIDNNCDGLIDANDPNCAAPAEICDNDIDDNLDGLTDCEDPQCNGFVYGETACGVGACAASGQEVCQTPNIEDSCQPGSPEGEGPFDDATCSDGIDNDCDGLTDVADPDCEAPPEICDNGSDDNGNGLVDCEDPQCDGFMDGACATGLPGICAAGTFVCQDGGQVCEQNQPVGSEGPFGDVTCEDGLDNDCDGQTDDGDASCQPVPEICDDGIDNNGDGLVDCADPECDGFVGNACDTGNLGVCASGTSACRELQEFCDQNEPAGTEGPFDSPTCSDDLDNDCDGLSDADDPDCETPLEVCDDGIDNSGNGLIDCEDAQCDGVTFGACDTGNDGICSAGTLTCDGSASGPVCTQDEAVGTEGPFADATCSDGLDNDCDGLTDATDPDCEEQMVEICDNGVDDTGNGLADCADPECNGFVDGACDTGESGVCAAGSFVCQDGGQVCVQEQQPGTEGPSGSPTCGDGLDNDCDGLTDADDPDCATPAGDVYLKKLEVPDELEVEKGRVVKTEVSVRGYSTQLKQDATVVLSAVASPNVAVVIEPVSITERVKPGRRGTEFEFTAFVSCNAAGRGTLDWTATVDALANADSTNDVQTGTTSVRCDGREEEDHDKDHHKDHHKDHDED